MLDRDAPFCSIRTARLRLRRIALSDSRIVLKILDGSPDIDLDGARCSTIQQAEHVVMMLISDSSSVRAWIAENEAGPVGLVCVYNVENGVGELALFIDDRHRGLRYATESGRAVMDYAGNFWKLRRLVARTQALNIEARALVSRLGFRDAGCADRIFQHSCSLPRAGDP